MGKVRSISNNSVLKIKNRKKPTKKFTVWRMCLWGMNLIVGYTFLIAIAPSYNKLGSWCLVLLIISGALAAVTGYGFGKLGTKFFLQNGGVMHYANKVLGRRASGFFGFFQLLQLVIISSTVAIGFIWAFGDSKISGKELGKQWYIIVLCLAFFFIISAIPRFGFSANKTTLVFIWIAKWFIIVGSILAALCMFHKTNFKHFIGSNFNGVGKGNFFTTFFEFFSGLFFFYFAFSGIEIIPTMLRDIKNPRHNIMRVLLMIVAGTLIFYLMYYVVIGSGLGVKSPSNPSGFPINTDPNNGDISKYNPVIMIFTKFLHRNHSVGESRPLTSFSVGIVVLVLIVIAMFANKSAGRMQQGWANTRVVSSYSRLGFLPRIFYKHKNKYGQYTYAFWFDFIMSGLFAIIFLILNVVSTLTKNPNLNVGYQAPLELTTFCAFLQYICAFLILFILGLRHAKLEKIFNRPQKQKNHLHSFINTSKRKLLFYFAMLCLFITLVDLWICSLVYDLKIQINNNKHLTASAYSDITEIMLVVISIIAASVVAHFGAKTYTRNQDVRAKKLHTNQVLIRKTLKITS